MEAQRHGVQVAEHLQGDGADGALAHLGEKRVAELAEGERQHPGGAVGEYHPDGQGERRGARVHIQGIDGVAIKDGHEDHRNLGQRQADERQHHPGAQAPLALGPEIGQKAAQRAYAAEGLAGRVGVVAGGRHGVSAE